MQFPTFRNLIESQSERSARHFGQGRQNQCAQLNRRPQSCIHVVVDAASDADRGSTPPLAANQGRWIRNSRPALPCLFERRVLGRAQCDGDAQ